VDAAYAGSAALLPEMKWILKGCENADSFLMNPHKWLFVPFDCTAFYTKHPDILARAFSLVPDYLHTGEEGIHNLMDYGIQLGRRFRALKLWFVFRMYGKEGLEAVLRRHLELAQLFARWVRESSDFEMMAPVHFSLVCFRTAPANRSLEEQNRLNERLMNEVNQSGEMYLSHTKLDGKIVLRLAIGNMQTELAHVQKAWEILQSHLRRIRTM
jgi:aromatic-L-amino-acid decarboxylase